ncbi:MAG: hypothetical protein U9N19_05775 [Thermodesulfobacteriota bacterium]|nr:hypothetical protein [Thermodesulfobacteriota bacterium]
MRLNVLAGILVDDDADAAMLYMHGGDDGYWRGSLRTNDGCDDCRIDAR